MVFYTEKQSAHIQGWPSEYAFVGCHLCQEGPGFLMPLNEDAIPAHSWCADKKVTEKACLYCGLDFIGPAGQAVPCPRCGAMPVQLVNSLCYHHVTIYNSNTHKWYCEKCGEARS